MSGFRVRFNIPFFENRKQYSKILLKNLWTNGLKATFSSHDATELRFKPDDWAVMTVHSFHGLSWVYLPILPFILFHESLHLIICYFTPRDKIVRYLPPVLDLFYLPVAFVLIFQQPTFPSLVLGDWIAWAWVCLFMANLQGDFRREKRNRPQKTEP